MNIALISGYGCGYENKKQLAGLYSAAEILSCKGARVLMNAVSGHSLENDAETLLEEAELAVVFGGDGSLIHLASKAAKYRCPVLGINKGHLGFLSEGDEFTERMAERILQKRYMVDERMMLEISLGVNTYYAVNDLVVSKDGVPGIVEIDSWCNRRNLGKYRCDGMVVATPTGSTAYSLSAGGSVVDPGLECLCLTPVCAHSLSARPVIFSPVSEIEIGNGDSKGAILICTVDGVPIGDLKTGQRLSVKKSEIKARFARISDSSFYDNLRAKLTDL